MLLIRLFEERLVTEVQAGNIPGMLHLAVGQEAAAAGVCAALKPEDYVVTTHRGHGHVLARGAEPWRVMAEIFGRSGGTCGGRGGSMHVADFSVGVICADAIVGGCLPIATGAALGAKMRGEGRVTACFFGDGASNQGPFHESLNLASLWALPIVYVCENNLYGASSPARETLSVQDVAVRAAGYGIAGEVVDGNDVMAVAEAAARAVEKARSGQGPTLLECKTYRFRSHMEGRTPASDPYRPEAEVAAWRERCPIDLLQGRLLAQGAVSRQELEQMRAQVATEVEEAARKALESDYPSPADALLHVYAGEGPPE